jgi:hypothetical protein
MKDWDAGDWFFASLYGFIIALNLATIAWMASALIWLNTR